MVTGGPSHKSALGIRSRPTQGVGLGRPASSGRQLAHLHLALSRNSKSHLKLLKKIERAIPRGLIYLIADNLKIHDRAPWGKEVVRRAPEDKTCFHPEGSRMAQPH